MPDPTPPDPRKLTLLPADTVRYEQRVMDVHQVQDSFAISDAMARGLGPLTIQETVRMEAARTDYRLTRDVLAHKDHEQFLRLPFKTTVTIDRRPGLWQPWAVAAVALAGACVLASSLTFLLLAYVAAAAAIGVLTARPPESIEVPVMGSVVVRREDWRTFPQADLGALGVHLGDGARSVTVTTCDTPVSIPFGQTS